jgi:hypothetical protein
LVECLSQPVVVIATASASVVNVTRVIALMLASGPCECQFSEALERPAVDFVAAPGVLKIRLDGTTAARALSSWPYGQLYNTGPGQHL